MTNDYYGLDALKDVIDDGKYICNYPENPNVNDIITSNFIAGLKGTKRNGYTYTYDVPRHGDILKSIIINGVKNCVVKLRVHDKLIFSQKCGKHSFRLTPFTHGIPVVAFPYSQLEIIILSEKEPNDVLAEYLFLDDKDRKRLVQNLVHFDNVIIESGVFRLITDYVDPYDNVVLTPPERPDPVDYPEELKPKSWFW
jgi:hypothetical protein